MLTSKRTRYPHRGGRSGITSRPPLIQPHHLRKVAVVYVRGSALGPKGIFAVTPQRALVWLVISWGWPLSRIRIIDEDLGQPGGLAHPPRGLRRLFTLMKRRTVGLVVARDVTRISRDLRTAERFLTMARQAGVLLSFDGTLLDPASPRSR